VAVAIFVLVGVYLSIRVNGGQLFNPGPVSAKSEPGVVIQNFKSHADFEPNCNLCHQPLETKMAEACTACHTEVGDQISREDGTHGSLADVNNCAECHAEHKGRDFDPVKAALLNFDHNKTEFRLVDQHAKAECEDCHRDKRYDQADSTCVSCHSEPKSHARMFGVDCAVCHTSGGWKPALVGDKPFDHEQTNFSLVKHGKDYQGQALACSGCHVQARLTPFDSTACSTCHAAQDGSFIQQHSSEFGNNCVQCHDGKDRMRGFEHAQVFPLEGKHAQASCKACHANAVFHGTTSECSACHQDPAIHAGSFGLACQYCHTSESWSPALLKLHGFPLNHGGEGEADCATCHTGSYGEYTCYTCHDHVEDEIEKSHAKLTIPAAEMTHCVACHMDGEVHE